MFNHLKMNLVLHTKNKHFNNKKITKENCKWSVTTFFCIILLYYEETVINIMKFKFMHSYIFQHIYIHIICVLCEKKSYIAHIQCVCGKVAAKNRNIFNEILNYDSIKESLSATKLHPLNTL